MCDHMFYKAGGNSYRMYCKFPMYCCSFHIWLAMWLTGYAHNYFSVLVLFSSFGKTQAEVYAARAEAIETEMEAKLAKSKASLEESHSRLVGSTADSAKV